MGIWELLFWMVVVPLISFFIGLTVDIILPPNYRVKFQLRKKKLWKWVNNSPYVVGMTSRLDFKRSIGLQEGYEGVKRIFNNKNPSYKGTDIYLKDNRSQYDIDKIVQFVYGPPEVDPHEENPPGEEQFIVNAIHVTASSKVKYKDLRNQIEDIWASVGDAERDLIENFSLFPAKRTLYIEVENLEEFSGIFENLKADEVTGVIKDSNIRFAYYGNRLTVENTIDSRVVEWFKNIVAYVV